MSYLIIVIGIVAIILRPEYQAGGYSIATMMFALAAWYEIRKRNE